MLTNKLKLNPDKTEFFLIGNERQRSKYLSMLPIELLGVKTNPAKSARNLRIIFRQKFRLSLAYITCLHLMFLSHARICVMFSFTFIGIVQNHLQLLLCPVVSITAIQFCTVSSTLTSLGFSAFRTDWPAWWRSLLHLLAAFHWFVPFSGCQ